MLQAGAGRSGHAPAASAARPPTRDDKSGGAYSPIVELIKLDQGYSCGLSVTEFDAYQVYCPILAKGTKT